ncbi:MAG: hypothetical protein ACJ768_19165 [Gaiellaceae bacterium]
MRGIVGLAGACSILVLVLVPPGVADAPSGPKQLTLAATRAQVTFGQEIKLTGDLTGGYFSYLTIRASEFPFSSSRPLPIPAVTDHNGHFEMKVKPRRNTIYTATFPGTDPPSQSNPAIVFTDLAFRGAIYGTGSRLRVRLSVNGPADAKLAGRMTFIYLYRAARRLAVRVGQHRLAGNRDGHGHARIPLRGPRRRHGDYFFYCLRERQDDGFGKPDPLDAECGHRVLR